MILALIGVALYLATFTGWVFAAFYTKVDFEAVLAGLTTLAAATGFLLSDGDHFFYDAGLLAAATGVSSFLLKA